MDIPGEKKALQKIQELEKRIEERLARARANAEKKTAVAKTRAVRLLKEKEKKLIEMRRFCAKSARPRKNDGSKNENMGEKIDQKTVEELAKDILAVITRS